MIKAVLLSTCFVAQALCGSAAAFQIAPLGSRFESKLTNETESSLSKAAGKLGILLKSPVHEEITHLGYGCPADQVNLAGDTSCSGLDIPFASPYVIYGVRWNDLPPFRLTPNEGNCTYLGTSCRVDQTIRFSTQPICWFCLFKDAEKKAQTKRITGCQAGKDTLQGNVMTRSHFGDLQFLHAMASEEATSAVVTQAKILDWLEFAWRVASREIKPQTFLRDIKIPTIQEHFGCTEWRVSDLYILGRQDAKSGLLPRIPDIAFGSILHTVQDSFAGAHASREKNRPGGTCEGTDFVRPPRIIEFHNYGAQDGALHDEQDSRTALTASGSADQWPDAVEATRNLFALYSERASWDTAKGYARCLFELTDDVRPSSPGEVFRRVN